MGKCEVRKFCFIVGQTQHTPHTFSASITMFGASGNNFVLKPFFLMSDLDVEWVSSKSKIANKMS